jgi:hypothetical protein
MAILPADPANYSIDSIIQFGYNVLTLINTVAGTAAVIAFIYGSLLYFTGAVGGEKENKAAKGKTVITWAIIGIIVILLAQVIVVQALRILEPAIDPNTLINAGQTGAGTTTPTTTGNTKTPKTGTSSTTSKTPVVPAGRNQASPTP